MAPPVVEWRDGQGINNGGSVLAGADYLESVRGGLVVDSPSGDSKPGTTAGFDRPGRAT
jgi:hypothetical protein